MERITFDSCIRKRKKASNSGVGHMKREEKACIKDCTKCGKMRKRRKDGEIKDKGMMETSIEDVKTSKVNK